MPIFPVRKRAYLTYHTNASVFTGSTGTCGTYVFAANGLYDPDITGTGHQPMGFDQMMLFYYHYTVLYSKITVKYRNNSTTVPSYVSISRNGSSTAITDPDQLVESGNIEYCICNSRPDFDCIRQLSLDMDIAKFAGVDDLLDDEQYRGDSGSNPPDVEYFHLSFWDPSAATTFTTNADVVIEFDVMFTEPRKATVSLESKCEEPVVVKSKPTARFVTK